MKKSNQSGFEVLAVLILVFVLGLLITVGWLVYDHQNKNKLVDSSYVTQNILDLGKVLTITDCDLYKSKITVSSEYDLCYSAKFKVEDETIEYVVFKIAHPTGNYLVEPREDRIIRANGTVEKAARANENTAMETVKELTGCNDTDIGKYSQNPMLIHENGRIGLLINADDIKSSDYFNSICTIQINYVAYISYSSTDDPQMYIRRLAVHYELKDVKNCEQLPEIMDRSKEDAKNDCYNSQALIRNDIAICKKIVGKDSAIVTDKCSQRIAWRRIDPEICDQLAVINKETCKKHTNKLKSYLSSPVEIY